MIRADERRAFDRNIGDRNMGIIYEIKHPVQSQPADWSKWSAPNVLLQDGMDKCGLPHGQKAANPGVGECLDDASQRAYRYANHRNSYTVGH